MEPILKLFQPMTGVGVVKVYKPTLIKSKIISFLVIIDSKALSFNLNQDGNWNEIIKEGITAEMVLFIQNQIASFYLK